MLNNSIALPVPHLLTAHKGPLHQLEKHLLTRHVAIESWLREQWQLTPPLFYSSVDLRNAGFKLAPVDTNLFPAGFNNLCDDMIPLCVQAVQNTLEQICPSITKILLIPESHTRNIFYFEHLARLQEILSKAGYHVEIGSLLDSLKSARDIQLPSGKKLSIVPLERKTNKVGIKDFSPCFILLNNDLSEGVPEILQGLEQTIMPPLSLGWSSRLKSKHFRHYEQVSNEFASQFELDPWLISPLFRYCGKVDFMTGEGEECVMHHADILLNAIQQKYDEYGISHKPFLAIKADAGTYGMAVMMIQDAKEISQLNRKQRLKMAAAKGGKEVSKVIIQEGIYSFETWGEQNAVAEPVVYMIGKHVVGGFYRIHAEKGVNENLNAPGMNFEPLAFAEPCNSPRRPDENCDNRFYAYGVIARLAALAAAREAKEREGKK